MDSNFHYMADKNAIVDHSRGDLFSHAHSSIGNAEPGGNMLEVTPVEAFDPRRVSQDSSPKDKIGNIAAKAGKASPVKTEDEYEYVEEDEEEEYDDEEEPQ